MIKPTVPPLKKRGGFSLLEVIVAGFFSAIAFAAVLSLQSFVLNNHIKQWRRHKALNQTIYALKLLHRDIAEATYLEAPEIGKLNAKILIGYINVSSSDKTAKIVENQPQSYFLYCVNASGDKVYRYTGDFPVPLLNFNCGETPFSGDWNLLVDSSDGGSYLEWSFWRPEGISNSVSVRYLARCGDAEISGVATAQIQKSI